METEKQSYEIEMATSSRLSSDMDSDLNIVFTSIKAVLHSDEEVDCLRDGPDSLKTVGDMFSTADGATLEELKDFSMKLVQAIRSTLQKIDQVKPKLYQERALTRFHKLRVEKLPLVWNCMSKGLELPPVIALQQQSVNRHLFERILVDTVKSSKPTALAVRKCTIQLSTEEDNAVRYASGYVAMKLLEKYKKMSTATAAHFVECLSHMASSGEESSFYDYTLEWMTNIDRGGLFYVSDTTFSFFKAIEVKTQELLPQHLTSRPDSSKKNCWWRWRKMKVSSFGGVCLV